MIHFNGDHMPGFNISPRSKEQEWSSRLAKALRANAKAGKIELKKQPNFKAWSKTFSEMTKSYPRSKIEEVLDWYCGHLGDEFVPRCLSANTFCKRFLSIESAMRRLGTEDADVEITDEARELQEWLGGLRWPGDEKKDELWTIQVTLDRVTAYRRKLKSLLQHYEAQWNEFKQDYLCRDGKPLVPRGRRRDCNTPLKKFCLLEIMSGFEAASTTQWWMDKVHDLACSGWKGWTGNLRAWAWRTDVKIFLDAEKDRMTDEGHGCREWKAMMAEAGYPVAKEVDW